MMKRENKILLGIPASFVQYITHTLILLKDLRINPLYHIRCMYISKTINVSPKFGKKKKNYCFMFMDSKQNSRIFTLYTYICRPNSKNILLRTFKDYSHCLKWQNAIEYEVKILFVILYNFVPYTDPFDGTIPTLDINFPTPPPHKCIYVNTFM